jgi:hypothetical protein
MELDNGTLHTVMGSSDMDTIAPGLGLTGADLWTIDPTKDTRSMLLRYPVPPVSFPDSRPPLPCAPFPLALHASFLGSSFIPSSPESGGSSLLHMYSSYHILSRGMIACWNSHLGVLRRVAEGTDDVVIILEDDINMEQDLHEKLQIVSNALAQRGGWDIIFLGESLLDFFFSAEFFPRM